MKTRAHFPARLPPIRELPASAGLGASQSKIAILARSQRIFLREKSASQHTPTTGGATAPQRNCVRGTYAAASTAKNTVLAPARHCV